VVPKLANIWCRDSRTKPSGGPRKRGDIWTWYFDAVDPVTGKRRQRSKGGFRSKREAQAALSEALAAYRAGTLVEASRLTLGVFLDEWLPTMAGNLEPNTHRSTGTTPVPTSSRGSGTCGCNSSRRRTSALYSALATSRGRCGKGLKPKTVKTVIS
jgi:hypothetical protein